MSTRILKSTAGLLALAICLAVTTGCQTLPEGLLNSPSSSITAPTAGQASKGQYRVEISGPFVQPRAELGAITNKTTIQTALDESGAMAKFRTADITILRKTEEGRALKMPVALQPGKKEVKFEQDYALHPGDRVVVTGRNGGMLDKVVTGLFGDQGF